MAKLIFYVHHWVRMQSNIHAKKESEGSLLFIATSVNFFPSSDAAAIAFLYFKQMRGKDFFYCLNKQWQ